MKQMQATKHLPKLIIPAALLLAAITPATAQQTKPGQQIKLNPIAQAAAQKGVRKCLMRMNQVTNFVGANAKVGASLFVNDRNPDWKIASNSLAVRTSEQLTYVDAQYSPGPGNSCSAAYEAITYWNASCQIVANKIYGSFKPGKPLGQAISSLSGSKNLHVFLMPAGKGCVSIKKEVLY